MRQLRSGCTGHSKGRVTMGQLRSGCTGHSKGRVTIGQLRSGCSGHSKGRVAMGQLRSGCTGHSKGGVGMGQLAGQGKCSEVTGQLGSWNTGNRRDRVGVGLLCSSDCNKSVVGKVYKYYWIRFRFLKRISIRINGNVNIRTGYWSELKTKCKWGINMCHGCNIQTQIIINAVQHSHIYCIIEIFHVLLAYKGGRLLFYVA